MNRENENFFDVRTIAALVLVAGTFIGWQKYMQHKYPDVFAKKDQPAAAADAPAAPGATTTATTDAAVAKPEAKAASPAAPVVVAEKLIPVDNATMSFSLSSNGMGLKDFRVKKYTDRKGESVEIGHPSDQWLPLETRLIGRAEPLSFTIEKINPNMFVGRARLGQMEIVKSLEIIPEKYLMKFKIATTGKDSSFVGLVNVLSDEVKDVVPPSFFVPHVEVQEFYVQTAETHDRLAFGKDAIEHSWTRGKIASLGSQYFTQAVVDRSAVLPDIKGQMKTDTKTALLFLQYPVLNTDAFELNYEAFVGPKSHQLLSDVDAELAKVVNFGYFSTIAKYILRMLKWFYSVTGNWGVAIILLTILVRFLVLPFNLYSYKSMKSMQAIQPQIQSLKERYKDDQQKQQQEMMKLMRENKVNPIGGCLPVFLQFPIFIALYQVLGYSIELYQAPFYLWITDLSLKDPYYILPVLMGVTMFIQQKITPTPMDPAQAKVMLMMPLIFTFFMVTLPSGLTLYMFVGAVFGVLQQLYFMRDTKSAPAKA